MIQVVDIVMGWAGVGHREATLTDWLDWFGESLNLDLLCLRVNSSF